jgi:NifU-like protein involved in Fe-S cluster formation
VTEDTFHREILEEHGRNPQFDDLISEPTHKAEYQSAKTGNTCSITLNVEDGRLVEIGLKVQGSALATASASLLFSELKEQSLDDAQNIHERILKVLLEGETIELPGDLCVFNSIVRFPERHDCALLAWNALGEALSL